MTDQIANKMPSQPAKYVIWGLGNTLKKNSPSMEEFFPIQCLRTAFKLAGKKCNENTKIFKKLAEKAAEEYRQERRITQYVAKRFKLNEEILFQQYYADLATAEDTSGSRNEKQIIDQGILNAFQKTAEGTDALPSIEHRLLTNVSTFNAIFWLNRMGIKNYFTEIIGLDAVIGDNGRNLDLRNKSDNKNAVGRVMDGIPADRYQDVIVIDNDKAFLDLFKTLYPGVQTYECNEFKDPAKQKFFGRYVPGHEVADKISTFLKTVLDIQSQYETGPYKPPKSSRRLAA